MSAPKIKLEVDVMTNTDNAHLASEVVDTITELMSVKVKLGWNNYHGPSLLGQSDDATSGQVQMVIPFKVLNQANMLRITTPVQINGRGDNGFQRVTVFDLLGFNQDWGRWGVGPLVSVDTTGHAADRVVLGPAFGAVWHANEKLKLGFLSQNGFWTDTARSQLQPIIAYQFGDGWTISAGDLQFTYDWKKGRWLNVPVGFQFSKVVKIAGVPINFGLSQQYNLLNTAGQKGYSISLSATFLFPSIGHWR
ncbi:MAG TPA: hypothetical protein VGO57_14830 [Verrucomicrobiae bacterium]